MSNYTKTTNFTAKDALPAGDANKKIAGSLFDTEFSNVATAIASKADSISPTFTGTPAAPTASFGTSTTQLATTAFVQAALTALYPVGTIYTSVVATNPASTFGFGTWVEFGAGKVLVGQDAGDTSFDTLEETGGSKDAIVVSHTHSATLTGTSGSAGSHSHTWSGSATFDGSHTHSLTDPGHRHGISSGSQDGYDPGTGQYTAFPGVSVESTLNSTGITVNTGGYHSHIISGSNSTAATHTHSLSVSGTTGSTGSSGTNANLQPYVVVKMWKRTA